jgi:signal transduction histidine kinase
VKFTGPGDRVLIGSAADGRMIRLWVRDSGPGVAAGDADRIFLRFERGAGRAEGSGLGLAIVRAIAEAHGGSVRLEGTPGGGATFVLLIPQAVAPVPAVVVPREEVVL